MVQVVYKSGMRWRAALSRIFLFLVMLPAIPASNLFAQQKPDIAGDYSGVLGPLHLKLHIAAAADGALSGTLDSPDQGSNGIPCSDFQYDGKSLSFAVPAVHGTWKGTVDESGQTLNGTWSQGTAMPLVFTREQAFAAAAKPSPVDGIWLAKIDEDSETLRLQIQVKSDAAGKEYCTFDSLDQDVTGIACADVDFTGNKFSFAIAAAHAQWSGTLSADGNTLTGTWTQGTTRPMNFERQATAITLPPVPPPANQAAIAAVDLAQLKPLLDKDLAEALKSGSMAPATHVGVTIGVIDHGKRQVFSYGIAKDDSIFEIGSITKTFTGLILSQLVEQGKVTFNEPVRALLPEGTVAKPASGEEITLLDLATQHSGLPRLPDNFKPANNKNPYVDYTADDMYAYLKKQGVAKPATTDFLYSNFGFGLLGQALSNRAGVPYAQLLHDEITGPLGMTDTGIALSAAQQSRFISGHDGHHRPAQGWDFEAFAGAGAIRSTADDMLTYIEANLHPDKLPESAAASADGKTLSAAITQAHELRADAMSGMRVALAWLFEPESGNYWHNGATGAFSAYIFFNPKGDYGAVVLVNTSVGRSGSLADALGQHIGERLAGKPALVIQ